MTRTQTALIHMAIAGVAYAASAPLLASALTATGARCGYAVLQTTCSFGDGGTYDPSVYAALAGAVATMMVWARLRAYDRPWYPLIATFGLIALGVVLYDTLMGRPVIGGDKLANDTFNTLRFAVLASFILVFQLAKKMTFGIAPVLVAIASSLGGVLLAGIAFQAFSGHLIGATQLFVLFVVYAFGGFGVHLMAVSSMFAGGRMETAQ